MLHSLYAYVPACAQDSLSGQAKTMMFMHVAPEVRCMQRAGLPGGCTPGWLEVAGRPPSWRGLCALFPAPPA